ncbi:hypothetical protein [Rhizobium phage RHEph12]|nr:hypothetical protein [Rhizobium phage RHEph12]
MRSLEFGHCAAIYGIVGMTADETYQHLSKMKATIYLIPQGSHSVPFADVLVIDTVQTLIACKPYINSQMLVVVCDSAPNLATLKHALPLDYEGDVFSNFTLKPPPKSLPIRTKWKTPVPLEVSKPDLVRRAVQSIVSDSLLTNYNALTARMNKPARKMLREKMRALLTNNETADGIALFLQGLSLDGDEFVTKLRSKYFIDLRQAILSYAKGSTLSYVTAQFGINDTYEVTYFARLLTDA